MLKLILMIVVLFPLALGCGSVKKKHPNNPSSMNRYGRGI